MTTEHTPTDEDAVDNYVCGRGGDASGLSLPELRAEYGPEFDRFLARVRRDAAREALDGLAIDLAVTSGYTEAEEVRDWRDAHYPEETP